GGRRQRGGVQELDGTLRSGAMLRIGRAVGRGGRGRGAVRLPEQACKIVVDVGAAAAMLLDVGIGLARSLAGLARFHRRRECDVAGRGDSVWHWGVSGGISDPSPLKMRFSEI